MKVGRDRRTQRKRARAHALAALAMAGHGEQRPLRHLEAHASAAAAALLHDIVHCSIPSLISFKSHDCASGLRYSPEWRMRCVPDVILSSPPRLARQIQRERRDVDLEQLASAVAHRVAPDHEARRRRKRAARCVLIAVARIELGLVADDAGPRTSSTLPAPSVMCQ